MKVAALLLAALLTACGGGGSDSAGTPSGSDQGGGTVAGGTDSGGGDTGDFVDGPGAVQGAPLAAAVRYAAMDKVSARYGELRAQGVQDPDREQQVLAYMKTLPEFASVFMNADGTIWARFSDNSYYLFNGQELPLAIDDEATQSADRANREAALAAANPRRQVADAGDDAIPLTDSNTALVLDVFGGSLNEPNNQITNILTRRGYTVTNAEATLENLKNVSGYGVFYVSTHGEKAGTDDHSHRFGAMWTATEADEDNEAPYADDIAAGRLVVFEAATGGGFNGTNFTSRHYAITRSWISHYQWSFPAHSLAFLNFCWSDDGGIAAAVRDAGAGLTLGWSNAAHPTKAWRAALYFFDRALGTALADPLIDSRKKPGKARPFPAMNVYRALDMWQYASTTGWGVAHLDTSGADLLLAPSVKTMEMDDPYLGTDHPEIKPKLILHGWFGAEAPKSITVDGTPVNKITYVDSTEVDAELRASPGAGFAGAVEVTGANDQKSNAPPLTQWSGDVVYDLDPASPQIALTARFTAHATFRGDVHKYRETVDGDLQDPQPAYAWTAQSSTLDWRQTGTLPQCTPVSPQSGTISYGLVLNPLGGGTGFSLGAQFDRKAGTFQVGVTYLGNDMQVSYLPNGGTVPAVIGFSYDPKLTVVTGSSGDVDHGVKMNFKLSMGLNPDLSVDQWIIPGDLFSTLATQLTVQGMTASHAPTDDAEEDRPDNS